MLDRVEVDVVHMARIIALVPNSMLPKTSLPQIRRERIWTRSARRAAAMEGRLSNATFTLSHSYR